MLTGTISRRNRWGVGHRGGGGKWFSSSLELLSKRKTVMKSNYPLSNSIEIMVFCKNIRAIMAITYFSRNLGRNFSHGKFRH